MFQKSEHAEVTRTDQPYSLSYATVMLIEKLKDGKPGDKLTDDELAGICGKPTNVGGSGYSNLQTAIKRCVRQYNICWSRERDAGYIRCRTAEEVSQSLDVDRKTIGRRVKWSCRRGATVDIADLPDDMRSKHLALLSQLGTLEHLSRPSTTKRFTKDDGVQVDPKKLLEAIGKM